jgi:hypothetical protein
MYGACWSDDLGQILKFVGRLIGRETLKLYSINVLHGMRQSYAPTSGLRSIKDFDVVQDLSRVYRIINGTPE